MLLFNLVYENSMREAYGEDWDTVRAGSGECVIFGDPCDAADTVQAAGV